MENKKQKCSFKEHKEIDANIFCQECKIYMCNKCEKHHSSLFQNHHSMNLDMDIKEIFTGLCTIENHLNELDYFCKSHNVLCCAKCIAKVKRKGNGQHTDCEIFNVEDIVDEKKSHLKKNIKILEDLSNTFQSSVNELNKAMEKAKEDKEEIKLSIQKIFTKIRNELNNREDELLLEVDKKYEKICLNENILKENEKIPNKIKNSLEKGKQLDNDWENNKQNLNMLINECINIENYIKYINSMNESINNYNSNNLEIKFNNENEIDILESIKNFGSISDNKNDISPNINLNITNFNYENIKNIKKISDHCGYGGNTDYICDQLCFFISKKNEYVLAYIDSDSNNKSIIFYDIKNDNEIKKIINAHEKSIFMIKYYDNNLYDIILSSSANNDVKVWNYNECLNILTISKVFDSHNSVYSSSILFDNNIFYLFCVGYSDYIKIYNSSGTFYKNIGNLIERRYIDVLKIDEKKYIISGGNQELTVFNYPSFTTYFCFIEDKDSNYHIYPKIIKSNNKYILIDVGNFNKIKLWDFFNKNLIKKISLNESINLGGFISINNNYLIVGGSDGEIREFDIKNGIIIKKLKMHSSRIFGIKLIKTQNNNQYFVSNGKDKNIYLWSLN